MADDKMPLEPERRRYVRLDSVFPVLFRILSLDGQHYLSDWLQGFTNNISKGGICLDVNVLNPELAQLIRSQQVKISLAIEIPLARNPINAVARISWVRQFSEKANKYLIGLSYEQIDKDQNKKIFRYTWIKKLFAPLALTLIFILGLAFTINIFVNIRLIEANRNLVQELVRILQQSNLAEQKIKEINREKEDLQLRITTAQLRIQALEEEKARRKEEAGIAESFNDRIKNLSQEKASLQEQMISLQHKEYAVTEELLRLDKDKTILSDLNLNKMYQWLKSVQIQRTGLLRGFEGEGELRNLAFTYDQSLAVQVYVYLSDFENAEKILDFFMKRAQRKNGMFFNTYNVNTGAPQEENAYSGPNIWMGIAIAQYTKKSQNNKYLKLAEEIAGNLISLQEHSKDGGIPGGTDLTWYLYEHNLDAYAFFNMLYKITGNLQYAKTRDNVTNWLMANLTNTANSDVRRKRGDSTIVADTHMWAIVALGPEKLEGLGINPDRILEFAEDNFSTELIYTRPDGQTTKIKGFDFTPKIHATRGGVISSEWTAQFVMAFQIMADFYFKNGMPAKARSYEMKFNEYKADLSKMIISSPSPSGKGESCLPYATADSVDTGHGWMTPRGKTTGSVAGTAYAIFAYYKYNPLELQ